MVVDQLLQICERNFKTTQNKTKQKKTWFFSDDYGDFVYFAPAKFATRDTYDPTIFA